MKRFVVLAVAFVVLTAAVVSDIYSSLDISKEQAKKRLLESIGEGFIVSGEHNLVSKARSLPVEVRVAGVRQLVELAKEYTTSEEFKSDYKKWRNNRLNPGQKSKLGLPKFRKILDNAVDNAIDVKDNEDRYPADPQKLIIRRLKEFLEISKTVDFDARLNGSGFADATYEAKSDKWKMCYRAGREVVEAAREATQKWLNELK